MKKSIILSESTSTRTSTSNKPVIETSQSPGSKSASKTRDSAKEIEIEVEEEEDYSSKNIKQMLELLCDESVRILCFISIIHLLLLLFSHKSDILHNALC